MPTDTVVSLRSFFKTLRIHKCCPIVLMCYETENVNNPRYCCYGILSGIIVGARCTHKQYHEEVITASTTWKIKLTYNVVSIRIEGATLSQDNLDFAQTCCNTLSLSVPSSVPEHKKNECTPATDMFGRCVRTLCFSDEPACVISLVCNQPHISIACSLYFVPGEYYSSFFRSRGDTANGTEPNNIGIYFAVYMYSKTKQNISHTEQNIYI